MQNGQYEYISCNLCKRNKYRIYIKASGKKRTNTYFSTTSQAISSENIVICLFCGLIYVNPRLRKENILNSYSKSNENNYILERKSRTKTFKNAINFIKKYKKKGKLLDVGCAAGFFLEAARDEGFIVFGSETNKNLASWGKRELGLKIEAFPFERTKLKNDYFDIISFWDVLEHLTDPLSSVVKSNKLLKNDGIIVINYPDISSIWAKLFKKNWWFIVSVHLFYFDKKSIAKILQKSGFIIIKDKKHIQRLSLYYLLNRLGRYNDKLAKILASASLLLKFDKISIPYWAGQRMVIARKYKSVK